jgi:hypothetical protein
LRPAKPGFAAAVAAGGRIHRFRRTFVLDVLSSLLELGSFANDDPGSRGMSTEEALDQAEKLLKKLEEVRVRLEETQDSDVALELLGELSELAKQVQTEIERAARESDAHA